MSEYNDYLEDQRNDTIGRGLGSKYMPRLLELLPDYSFKNKVILDVGCGPFTTWDWIREREKTAAVIGLDIGKATEELAETWSVTKNEYLRVGDAHDLIKYMSPGTCDLVVAFHSFEHMYNLPVVLRGCYDVLTPGGYLYYALPMPSYNWKRGHWYDVPNESAMNEMLTNESFAVLSGEVFSNGEFRPEQEMVGLARKNSEEE